MEVHHKPLQSPPRSSHTTPNHITDHSNAAAHVLPFDTLYIFLRLIHSKRPKLLILLNMSRPVLLPKYIKSQAVAKVNASSSSPASDKIVLKKGFDDDRACERKASCAENQHEQGNDDAWWCYVLDRLHQALYTPSDHRVRHRLPGMVHRRQDM